jgi:ATP-dependent Clp protease ATP-binding subunit ClpA
MDAGVLTDNNGRKADFRNVILIMTTNVGAEMLSKRNIGFSDQSNESDAMNSLNKLFSPEFRNRLDEIIQFGYLNKEIILSVVDKFLIRLQAQLDKRNVELEISKSVINWIAENGYDKDMGARPMERFIASNIKKPLVDKLLFGDLKAGGLIKIDMVNGSLKFIDKKTKVKA